MPNLDDIMNPLTEVEVGDGFDPDKFLSEVDNIITSKSAEQRSDEPAPEGTTIPDGAPSPSEVAVGGMPSEAGEPEGSVPEEASSPPSVSATSSDPLAELSAERRAQLLVLDEYMREHPDALTRIASPPPAIAPEPITLPEHIDPGSVEATLWMEQAEQRVLLEEIRAGQRQTQEQLATERLRQVSQQAAQTAGANFAARYSGKLTQDDVLAIAQAAGQGIAGRLAAQATTPEEITTAYDEALEHVLWRTEDFRNKVVGPIVGVPDVPTPKSEDLAAAPKRKRALTALSGAASPVGGAPTNRPPIETREDGRLTGKSRLDLVRSLELDLKRANQS